MSKMSRKEKAAKIIAILEKFYPAPGIPLKHKDPFTLLCAVVLSARSTDAMVNRVTPKLFALADTPAAMAKLKPSVVRAVIRPCGLSPAKAKGLVGLSKILLAKHHGQVPRSFEALEALPAVGHKTASVVMCQAFGVPAFPVDTHIFRLARRWGISRAKSIAPVERALKAFFPKRLWIKLHLQMIYFGRQHCPALRHDEKKCPVCRLLPW